MCRQVLLDENLPQKLRLMLSGHQVVTTAYRGWAGKSNGALIAAAEEAGFEVLVTADQGLSYQNLPCSAMAMFRMWFGRYPLAAIPPTLGSGRHQPTLQPSNLHYREGSWINCSVFWTAQRLKAWMPSGTLVRALEITTSKFTGRGKCRPWA